MDINHEIKKYGSGQRMGPNRLIVVFWWITVAEGELLFHLPPSSDETRSNKDASECHLRTIYGQVNEIGPIQQLTEIV